MRTRNFVIAWLIACIVGYLLRSVFLNGVITEALRHEPDPVARFNLYSVISMIGTLLHGVVLYLVLEAFAVSRVFRDFDEPSDKQARTG